MPQSPETSRRFASAGVEPRTGTSAAFAQLIEHEVGTWRTVKDAGIQLD